VLRRWQADGNGPGSNPVLGFGVSGVELSVVVFFTKELVVIVLLFIYLFCAKLTAGSEVLTQLRSAIVIELEVVKFE
jgi:hypothetical protein